MPQPARHIVMTDPGHYEVTYTINPWMRPDAWSEGRVAARAKARKAWEDLAARLKAASMTIEVVPAEPGLPDLVFPANAATVLDGRVLLARFRHPERKGEEAAFRKFFEGLKRKGLVSKIATFPAGIIQEGAGDCIWDAHRQMFWAGYGPRSHHDAVHHIREFFGQDVVALKLVTPHYYHLDTCFCPLPGGEVLYLPDAFSDVSRARIADHVDVEKRIVATPEEAATFSLNAIAIGRDLIMASPPPRLRRVLTERGYRVLDVDLSSFMLSGGAAFCMTLRLDLRSQAAAMAQAAE